jgi:ABC-type nitrate/sulfonate/bicarbonate transport system substrate-binding protein
MTGPHKLLGAFPRWLGYVLLLIGASMLVVVLLVLPTRRPPELGVVYLHLTPQPVVAAFYQALRRGYFADVGLDVRVAMHATGLQAVEAMITRNDDYAVCADTPFVRAYSQRQPLSALACFGQAANSIHFIGRRDQGINTDFKSLIGHRLGVARGTNAEYVFYSSCLLYDLPNEQVTLIDLAPEDMVSALIDGRVDALALWDSLMVATGEGLGPLAVEIPVDDIYRAMWVLVVHDAHRDPRKERALLTALLRATADLSREPQRWLPALAADIGISPPALLSMVPTTTYRVTLDQSLLLNLEAQRRWLAVGGREVFDGLSPLPLFQVEPSAVTIVHPDLGP